MREYKFRGKIINNGERIYGKRIIGEWVYGNLIDNKYIIIQNAFRECGEYRCFGTPECYEVDPETLGQATGLRDKNGKEIYERRYIKGIRRKNTRRIII